MLIGAVVVVVVVAAVAVVVPVSLAGHLDSRSCALSYEGYTEDSVVLPQLC